MIRSDVEYRATLKEIEANREIAKQQSKAMADAGLTKAQIERAMQPLLSFQAQFDEEVAWYDAVRRHEIGPINNLTHIGRMLIGLRIANGISQKELADRLGISEAQVSRDERNEYHNVTVDRVQRILDVLNEDVTLVIVNTPMGPMGSGAAPSRRSEIAKV